MYYDSHLHVWAKQEDAESGLFPYKVLANNICAAVTARVVQDCGVAEPRIWRLTTDSLYVPAGCTSRWDRQGTPNAR